MSLFSVCTFTCFALCPVNKAMEFVTVEHGGYSGAACGISISCAWSRYPRQLSFDVLHEYKGYPVSTKFDST